MRGRGPIEVKKYGQGAEGGEEGDKGGSTASSPPAKQPKGWGDHFSFFFCFF